MLSYNTTNWLSPGHVSAPQANGIMTVGLIREVIPRQVSGLDSIHLSNQLFSFPKQQDSQLLEEQLLV